MLFLNPTILLGLFAASIPLLIHLLNLRKLKKIDFSTLKFLKELQKSKIKKIKLKQWLLLTLRILIIFFIVFSFARPTLKVAALAGTTSASKTSAVFVLDDSFSMSLVESKGSLFNQSKAEINKILSLLKEGDDAEIILISNAKTNEYKLIKNLNSLRNKIKETKITPVAGFINDAVIKGLNLLSTSKNFNKELYIFSDFQKRSLFANILKNKKIFDDIRLYTIKFGGIKFQNAGIDKLSLGTQILEKNKPIKFYATVTNYSSEKMDNIVLSLYINGERKSQRNFNLNPGTSINMTLNSEVTTTGYITSFVEIDDDNLLQDNKRYINFYIPQKINVGLFSGNSSDKQFVLPALTSGKNKDIININEANSNQLTSLNLTNFDVIIFIPSKTFTNLNRLEKYVEGGGRLILFPGGSINPISFKNILTNLKIKSEVTTSGIKTTNENYISFDRVDFTHPVFENLFEKKKKKGIDSPNILFHFNIKVKNSFRQIIQLNDGSTFLSEIKRRTGKIFLFNTAPVLSWSNFPIKGIFAPLLNKSIFYLSSQNLFQKNYFAGDEVKIKTNNFKKGVIEILEPNKTSDFITLDENRNNGYINYKKTDQTGNYEVINNKKVISMFSINTEPKESEQKYLTNKEFENYLQKINFKGKYIPIKNDENILSVIEQARFGTELWKYFIILALLLAVIEMLVARNTKKELTNLNKL